MASEQPLYHPRQLYEQMLRDTYHRTAEAYFDELQGKAGVNLANNQMHLKDYADAQERTAEAQKAHNKMKAKKGWMIFAIVLGFICLIIPGILLLNVYKSKIKTALAEAEEALARAQEAERNALNTCWSDMAPLNDLLGDFMPGEVMERATPIIDLDPTFSPERFCYLHDRFGLPENEDMETSVLGVISGHIQGNPFILEDVYRHEIRDTRYEGTLTITWTTTHRDSRGNTYTQTHSQTLHAESYHPAPAYWEETRLVYGSEVAPDLHFSRTLSGKSGLSEKENRKFVDKKMKEYSKIAEKDTRNGGTLSLMANDEFEAYFGALDRDNEVQFRMLFTPLAQRNMLDIIKNPQPFGDDFNMVKDGMLTSVCSLHSQKFNYHANAEWFADYDFARAKERFVSYCDEFIKNLYFDLAPIISIPLYQVHKPSDYIYHGDYISNITAYEHEALVNKMDASSFYPEDADHSVPLILKDIGSRKAGASDNVRIHALGYHTTPMVDYVPVMGGDGRMHQVPVHWTQYDAVECVKNVGMSSSNTSRSAFNHPALQPLKNYLGERNFHFERGLISFFLGEGNLSSNDGNQVHNLLSASDE